MNIFGQRVKKLRIAYKLSLAQLSKSINISVSTIHRWEIGKSLPTATALKKLAQYFNVRANYLLGLED